MEQLAALGFNKDIAGLSCCAFLAAHLTQLTGKRDSRISRCTDATTWANISRRGFLDEPPFTEEDLLPGLIVATSPSVEALVLTDDGENCATGCLRVDEGGVDLFQRRVCVCGAGCGWATHRLKVGRDHLSGRTGRRTGRFPRNAQVGTGPTPPH